jgi:hypothetical protein
MNGKKALRILCGSAAAAAVISAVLLFCSSPQNPFSDSDNVTIDIILPDTAGAPVYTRDTITITIVTQLTDLIDSITVTAGTVADSLFTALSDTLRINYVFLDTGTISVSAMAFCEKGVNKECRDSLHVHKNPLSPPDTVYTNALSDTSAALSWATVRAAKKYGVYRSETFSGTFSPVDIVVDSVYIDSGLSPSTTYYYKVSSWDSLDRESPLSGASAVTTLDIGISQWDEMVWDQDKWE